MSEQVQKGFDFTMNFIAALSKLPLVRVDREAFLKRQFKGHDQLDRIIAEGPQAVFTSESLRKKAEVIIKTSTRETTFASFLAGLPSNIAVAVAAGGADLAQFFGFALNLAQQLAYLFGEDDLFTGKAEEVNDQAKGRIVAYLGVMLGAAGAASLLVATSKKAAEIIGKKVAAQALMKTSWYPLLKKVAAWIGIKVTKQSFGKAVSKSIPVLAGVASAGITYFTFKPMGRRLADVFRKNLDGEFDIDMVLKENEEAQEVIDNVDYEISDVDDTFDGMDETSSEESDDEDPTDDVSYLD